MSMGAVLVGLLLLGLTAYAATIPWRQRARQGAGQAAEAPSSIKAQVANLEAQAESSYAALADLDFDRKVGKLNGDDYQRVRGQLMAETVAVLRELDPETDIESKIAALVSARRVERSRSIAPENGRSGTFCPACGARARAGDHYCVRCGAALGPACPTCGGAVKSGDVFCARCGSTLTVGAATA